jgi:hypothetical protein
VKQLSALGPEHRWPASLSALVGAAANANGPVTMPRWNGNAYRSEMTFGD